MQDFETTAEDSEHSDGEEKTPVGKQFSELGRDLLKRFILLLSFGPGILGFMWLLGRILRR